MTNAASNSSGFLRDALTPLVLRCALASIFILHGYAKISQDGGASWVRMFHLDIDLPPAVCMIVAWGEFVGGIALLLGLFARVAALGLAVIMSGAIWALSHHVGFVVADLGPERSTRMSIVGYEYNVAILAICFAIMVLGSGWLSLDYVLCRSCRSSKSANVAEAASLSS